MKNAYSTLPELINVCKIHEERLAFTLDHIAKFLPMTPENLGKMTALDSSILDSAVNRFMQLQDTLGKKVFPRILKMVSEYEVEESFLDRLSRLERLRVISSADLWEELRDLRNELSHEYAVLDPAELSKTINNFISACQKLRTTWYEVYAFLTQHGLN